MKPLKLNIDSINLLNEIRNALSKQKPLTKDQQAFLINFLNNLPETLQFLSTNIPLDEELEITVLDLKVVEAYLEKWITLFDNIPGYDYAPCCLLVGNDVELLNKNVIMVAFFAPSMSYNLKNDVAFEVHLKDDGMASFNIPTIQDAEQYPELYQFKGTWTEAYYLLIETLHKGWPMEEFPEELQKFLPKQ